MAVAERDGTNPPGRVPRGSTALRTPAERTQGASNATLNAVDEASGTGYAAHLVVQLRGRQVPENLARAQAHITRVLRERQEILGLRRGGRWGDALRGRALVASPSASQSEKAAQAEHPNGRAAQCRFPCTLTFAGCALVAMAAVANTGLWGLGMWRDKCCSARVPAGRDGGDGSGAARVRTSNTAHK